MLNKEKTRIQVVGYDIKLSLPTHPHKKGKWSSWWVLLYPWGNWYLGHRLLTSGKWRMTIKRVRCKNPRNFKKQIIPILQTRTWNVAAKLTFGFAINLSIQGHPAGSLPGLPSGSPWGGYVSSRCHLMRLVIKTPIFEWPWYYSEVYYSI